AGVARVVPAGALELATGFGQLPLLRERQPEPGARLGIRRLRREDALELGGGLGRAPRLEQREPEIAPVPDVAGPELHDTREVGDGRAEVAAVAEERSRLAEAEGAIGIDFEGASPDLLGVAPDRELLDGQRREPDDPGEAREDDTPAHAAADCRARDRGGTMAPTRSATPRQER